MTPFDGNLNNQHLNSEENNFVGHLLNNQSLEIQPDFIEVTPQANELTDPLLKRVGNSYQILAAAVLRANQAKKELQTKIHVTQEQIVQYQQKLNQISEQLVEPTISAIPQNTQEVTQQLTTMKGYVRDKHYNTLATRLSELQQADHLALPTIIDSMRAELDLIEIRVQKIKILESLREAYSSHEYFQDYFSRADAEFKNLLAQY